MVIVLVRWKIKPSKVEAFLEYWRKTAIVQDREGLVGEFLSEACHTSEFPWITWDLTGCEGVYRSFVNVGIWNNAKDFHEQIGKYFKGKAKRQNFEYEERIRAILRPTCWRMGDAKLPIHCSDGTL